MKKQAKKYFIRDDSLHNVDNDKFNYADISKVLDNVIATNDPPYNVALIGKWGLGKSSLINLVIDKLSKKSDDYLIQYINAWKYEKESLSKVFLKQLWQGVSGEKFSSYEVIRKEVNNLVNNELNSNSALTNNADKQKKPFAKKVKDGLIGIWNWFKTNKTLIVTILVVFLASVAAFIIYKGVQADLTGNPLFTADFWGHSFLSYCKNIATILLFPVLIALFKTLLDSYHNKANRRVELNFPLENTDDYEIFLEAAINKKIAKNKNYKIVTVIDDLDRLSIDKIVEALDALKAFVGFQRCTFIVPFDDEIIKLALEKRRIRNPDDSDDIIESELILDKLFQYKIYMPPLLKFDIRKYALDLAENEIPDFLKDYCSAETIEKLINRILIHSDVSTPRQVKKLLNAFVNNYMIAYERESSGKVEHGLFTSEKGQQQIAKFSVLQADFNKFYDLLFQDFNYLEGLLSYHQKEVSWEDTPEDLRQFFIYNEDGSKQWLKREFEPLINFLTKTQKFAVDNIAPYLYLAQDDISRVTGDETQRRIINALESGNKETVRSVLESNPAAVVTISHHLLTTNDEMENVLSTTISLFKDLDDSYKGVVATAIADRTFEVPEKGLQFLYNADPEQISSVSDSIDNEIFAQRFIDRYLLCFIDFEWTDVKHIAAVLAYFEEKWDSLQESTREIVSRISELSISSERISAGDFISASLIKEKELFENLWGLRWVIKLCDYIDSENDFSDAVAANFINAVALLSDTQNINSLVAPIIPLTKYSSFINVVDEALIPSISEQIKKPVATQIVTNLLSLEYDECAESIHSLLSKLHYSITTDNAEMFCDFTLRYKDTDAMNDVLLYCGQNEYFALLDPTIQDFINSVFEDNNNDELLKKIQGYFTEEQRDAFFVLLSSKSAYNGGDDYERPSSLIIVASKSSKNSEHLDKLVSNILLRYFSSRYSNSDYFEFVSCSIGVLKGYLQTSTMDAYITTIENIFPSSTAACLNAVERLSGVLSSEQYAKLFPLIIQYTQQSSFEASLDIIINNKLSRPTDSNSCSIYRNFLVDNVATSPKPERILQELEASFNFLLDLNMFIQESLKNRDINSEQMVKLVSKSFNNYSTIDIVVEELLPILQNCPFDLINKILQGITKYQMAEIISQTVDKIDDNTPMHLLSNILLVCNQNREVASFEIIEKVVQSIFAHDNVPDQVSETIRLLVDIDKNLVSISRKEIASLLYTGYHITSSEEIRISVINIVAQLGIKRQFRSLLEDVELDFYKKWTK